MVLHTATSCTASQRLQSNRNASYYSKSRGHLVSYGSVKHEQLIILTEVITI